MSKTVHLQIPLSEEEVRALELDDVVYLTGEAYQMLYADHYTILMDMVKVGKPIPYDLEGGVLYNTGTIYRKTGDKEYDIRALGTTTSSKFNAQTPEFIRMMGVRAVLGKGGMDAATLEAMKECGCVYLALAGGCSAVYTPAVEIIDDFWPELMPVDNQRLKFRFKDFGPLFVSMDAHGNSLYAQVAGNAQNNLPKILDKLGIEQK